MNRIVIVGATGSGKTYTAEKLRDRLRYPVVDLDNLFWRPAWRPSPPDEFRDSVHEHCPSGGQWIATGNYEIVRDILWTRADMLIWIDYGFFRTAWNLCRRTLRHLVNKTLHCNGNTESLRRLLSRESIGLYLLKSYRRHKRSYATIFADPGVYPHLEKIRLADSKTMEHFFASLRYVGKDS